MTEPRRSIWFWFHLILLCICALPSASACLWWLPIYFVWDIPIEWRGMSFLSWLGTCILGIAAPILGFLFLITGLNPLHPKSFGKIIKGSSQWPRPGEVSMAWRAIVAIDCVMFPLVIFIMSPSPWSVLHRLIESKRNQITFASVLEQLQNFSPSEFEDKKGTSFGNSAMGPALVVIRGKTGWFRKTYRCVTTRAYPLPCETATKPEHLKTLVLVDLITDDSFQVHLIDWPSRAIMKEFVVGALVVRTPVGSPGPPQGQAFSYRHWNRVAEEIQKTVWANK